MQLSPPFLDAIRNALNAAGDSGEVQSMQPVSGGCINHATRLETATGVYLLKWNEAPLPAMFAKEWQGLDLLASTHTVRVPRVLAAQERLGASIPAFILLEYIQPPQSRRLDGWSPEGLGEQLAQLHLADVSIHAGRYGLDDDNYIGSSIQKNGWNADWAAFFAEKRIGYQMELARQNGRLPAARAARLERLIARLPALLDGVERAPALLHGDLWAGNVISDAAGRPVLIDPAVYFGDREAEIAYTELFGGFSGRFYQAYQAVHPLESGYAARRDLYNLYHLLNHLNLFGDAYAGQVDAVLRYYVGG